MAVEAGGIASAVAEELGSGLRGEVVWPGDRGYDAARAVFNGMIDRRPLAVIRPADASEVVRCITFARRHDLPLSVRGAVTTWQGTRCATARSCLTCPP
jgi:FAD/FMN-containing dehydrogenase